MLDFFGRLLKTALKFAETFRTHRGWLGGGTTGRLIPLGYSSHKVGTFPNEINTIINYWYLPLCFGMDVLGISCWYMREDRGSPGYPGGLRG